MTAPRHPDSCMFCKENNFYEAEKVKNYLIEKDYSKTIDLAKKKIEEDNLDSPIIVICGSLYLVGAIRELINS